ncbi:MAG: histidine kinase [Bacteroidota bacterium]|nr:histidine kinase [Bacteroidota bacterium]
MLVDRAGYLWAGTWQSGLLRMRYRFVDDKFQLLSTDHFFPKSNIRSLFKDSKGNIWAGTRYDGVYRLANNDKNDRFSILNFSQKNGLTSNFIKAIREDASGNFWLAFYNGLDKLIPEKGSFQIFNFSKVNNYFASIVGIETGDDNTLWLATSEGIVKIKDGELEKTLPLPVYITKVLSPDSIYSFHARPDRYGRAKNTTLTYRHNEIQFEFSAPGYINEKQILYSYRLYGDAEKEWSKAANQHVVSYAGLQPGKYQFEVRTLGWNGAWGQATVFNFTIAPPFWKTWWFISIISLCTLLLLYIFIRWRIKTIRMIEAEKLKVQQLESDHYKSELEMEQVINYFSSSLIDKNTVNDVLWDVAKNLIGKLGFEDCMIYLWNDDKTKMMQRAGLGPKGSVEEISKQPFDVVPGQGVVGYVMETKEAVLIPDTSKDERYRADELTRLSEITVPVIYNNELIGVIDSEHHEKNFFTRRHLQILNTIATLVADKIKSIEAAQLLQHARIEVYSINEQLSKARLEALRSQMNPHFIFNCINSIDALIQSNDKYNATVYLNKFAKLLRGILDSSKQNTVSLANDLDTLKLYIELEQFRHEDKFTAEIQADDDLLHDDYKVPPLIVQPFVENAILHGLRYRNDHDGRLCISVNRLGNYIQYLVEDNGVGRNNFSNSMQKNKLSYGIDMSNERVKLFNREEKASVQITDLFSKGKASGTKVEVYLKIDEC